MKKIRFLSGLLLLATCLSAQNFYDFKGVGARAAGMAFAFNAVADDATAISWNPAGLSQLKKPEFSLIQRVQMEELSYNNLQDISLSNIQEGKPYHTFDYLSFIYPLRINDKELVLGIAYQNQINFKFTQTLTYPNANHEGSSKGTTTVNSVSVCAAYSLSSYLSFGLAFNKYFSLGNRNDWNYIFRNTENNVYMDMVEVYSFSGFNAVMGAFADMTSAGIPLRLAARVNTPLNLKNDFSSLTDYHFQYPRDDLYAVQRKEGSETYHIPFILGTGASYRFGDYLTIAADYDIKPFRDAERSMQYDYYDDLAYVPSMNTLIDSTDLLVQSNDNLNQFRVGIEYILHPDVALIPLRIGWKNNPSNLANMDHNGNPSGQVFARSFNAGVGFISSYFSLDFAYEYYKYNQEGVNNFTADHVLHSFILSLIVYIR